MRVLTATWNRTGIIELKNSLSISNAFRESLLLIQIQRESNKKEKKKRLNKDRTARAV